jgi:uncharacterized RDD family membrane protein YckC
MSASNEQDVAGDDTAQRSGPRADAPGSDAAALADIPVRLTARIIDIVVLVAVELGLGQLMGYGFDWLLLGASLVYAYFVGCDVGLGATLGKFALGLRVIGPSSARPTLRQALIREAFTLLGAIPLVGPLLALGAWIWIAVSIRASALRQGKHDMLAGGTRVVRLVRRN